MILVCIMFENIRFIKDIVNKKYTCSSCTFILIFMHIQFNKEHRLIVINLIDAYLMEITGVDMELKKK